MPTVSTLPLILIFLLLWRLTGGRILCIVAFVSVFTAASALDFGSLGISPWLFVLALGLLLKVLQGHRIYHPTTGINRSALWMVIAFFVYAGWSSVAYPLLFHGTPVVRTVAEEPLIWGMSNFAQLCYLLSAATLYAMTIGQSRKDLSEVLTWYLRGCVTASLFAMYQLLNVMTHIPYPSTALYSNKAHVVYNAYLINGLWRLNGTFCEASEMAGFLSVGLALTGWRLVTQPFQLIRLFSFALMLVSLLLTFSSVGYLTLGYVAVAGTFLAVRHVSHQGSLSIPRVVFAMLLMLTFTTFFVVTPAARTTVQKVITSTLLDKQSSDSYRNRTQTHVDAVATLERTYYMGAGLGSARASGLAYILMATVGLPGCLLFSAFLVALVTPLFKTSTRLVPAVGPAGDQYGQAVFALSVLLLAMVIAGAEPIDPMLWMLIAIATVAREPSARSLPRVAASAIPYLSSRMPA